MKRLTEKTNIKETTLKYLFLILLSVAFLSCSKKEATPPGDVLEVTTIQIQPDIYFHQAITDFTNRDFQKSAENIRNAISVMDSIAGTADEEQKVLLNNSIAELNSLQTNVASDKVSGIEDLNYYFAKAGQALAGYHMHVYKTEYYNMEGKKAAKEMQQAIAFIENSVAFNDREFDAEELALISKIKNQIDQLSKGTEVTKEDIETSLSELNAHMTKWGNEIEVKYRNFNDTQKAVITH